MADHLRRVRQAWKARAMSQPDPAVDHPAHYGGEDNPYEVIKVIENWNLGFHLGNTVKYVARADHKGEKLRDLKKALWYLQRAIRREENKTDKTIKPIIVLKPTRTTPPTPESCM